MFERYRSDHIYDLRPVTQEDINDMNPRVSVSVADREKGSSKIGDMIARNPLDYGDMWLIEKKYFEDNFVKVIPPELTAEFICNTQPLSKNNDCKYTLVSVYDKELMEAMNFTPSPGMEEPLYELNEILSKYT